MSNYKKFIGLPLHTDVLEIIKHKPIHFLKNPLKDSKKAQVWWVIKLFQIFYRQLGFLAFSLIFWPKNLILFKSNFLATVQPQIGLFSLQQTANFHKNV